MNHSLSASENSPDKFAGVQSLQRGLCVLEAFSLERPELNISEICSLVNLPRPTVTRLASTLTAAGYLSRDKASRKYSLGVKLCRLGGVAQKIWQPEKVALPLMRQLNNKFQETVYLDCADGLERLCILSVEGTQAVRTVVPVGQRSPLYAGSDGRTLLAYQPEAIIDELISGYALAPKTPHTITEPAALKEILAEIRREGTAVSYGEWVPGSVGISAPVRGNTGEVIAALSMSVPDYRASGSIIAAYRAAVRETALKVSEGLGFAHS